MGQISYFLFYPSSGTASIIPRHSLTRVQSWPIMWVQHDDPFLRHALGPTLGAQAAQTRCLLWPISWKAQPLGWTAYESFTLQVSPTHSTVHSAPWARVILRVGSHPTAWVTPYGLSRHVGWGILLNGSLYEYGQFLWSLLTLPDLTI